MSRPTPRLRAPARTASRGFTLIEVLVSLLVFSLGVLGLAGFQALLTRQSAEASERGRAALMANELVAEMWKARDTSLDDATLAAWEARVEDPEILGLPDGKAEITELDDEEGAVLIQITWTSVVRGNETSTYMTELAIPPLSTEE
jgi:type IV pilus assembly protein PilV